MIRCLYFIKPWFREAPGNSGAEKPVIRATLYSKKIIMNPKSIILTPKFDL
jgi:hypothetical protein